MEELQRLARHLTRPQDADDDVQDTMVTALSRPGPKRSPAAWLKQVLRNTVRGRVRRARRWDELSARVPPPEPPPRPDEVLEEAEIASALRDVVEELDEPYRTAVRERFFNDRSMNEIAEGIGCPHGTVRWRVHEGLKRMRHALDQRFGERRNWVGAVALFSGDPTLEAAPASGAAMNAFAFKLLLPGILIASAACLGYGLTEDEARVSTPAAEPRLAAAPAAEATLATAPAQGPATTPTRDAAPAPSPDTAKSSPPTPPNDHQRCATEAIAAFNTAEDDPEADEHLVDAAQCFEKAGIVGKAIRVHSVLMERYPDTPNADASKEALTRLWKTMLDADAGLETELGKDCIAPIAEREDEAQADEYIAAAECLYGGGALVAAALRYRELAKEQPGKIDNEANDEMIAKFKEMLVKYADRAG